MPTRYEYDLDHNGEWRWIAVGGHAGLGAISPMGYSSLQDCMHAVGLMLASSNVAVLPGVPAQQVQAADLPESSLSRLDRRLPAA